MSTEMQKNRNESIADLIKSIEANHTLLPEFQRNFVWSIQKTLDLFDSLVRNIFIGAVIYGKPSFEITIREWDKRPRRGEGSREILQTIAHEKEAIHSNFRLVLDGQQRITSLYRALKKNSEGKDIDEVWMVIKNEDKIETGFFEKDMADINLEKVLENFSFQEDKDHLCIKMSDVYTMMLKPPREHTIKKDFFEKLSYPKNKSKEKQKILFDRYLTIKDKLTDLLKNNKLFNYYMLDMSLDKFALFFERSNSLGVNLNFIDILTAKLYVGFKLRDKIRAFNDKYPQDSPLLEQIIVRTIAYQVSDGNSIEKSYILKKLEHRHFTEHWDNLINLYTKSLDFLKANHFVISAKWMPYENMLIPLMIFLNQLKGKSFDAMTERQKTFVSYWYWASIFSAKYSGSSNEVILKDADVLTKIANKQAIEDSSFFNRISLFQINKKEDLYGFKRKRSAIYQGVLSYIYYYSNGYKGWTNSNNLSENNQLEDHHIFPKTYIKKIFEGDSKALGLKDCVLNRALIPKITNLIIGSKKPSVYLTKLKEKHYKRLASSLTKHLVPPKLISGKYDDDFLGFLEERAILIFDAINEKVISQKDNIEAEYNTNSEEIKVYGKYLKKTVRASFNLNTQEVTYKKRAYSPSGAARQAKTDIKKEEVKSVNGWQFWRFKDPETKEEMFITAYKY